MKENINLVRILIVLSALLQTFHVTPDVSALHSWDSQSNGNQ